MPGSKAHGSWSPALRTLYLDRLSLTGSVRDAASLCGLSRQSVYKLRRRDALFARAWKAALDRYFARRAEILLARYRGARKRPEIISPGQCNPINCVNHGRADDAPRADGDRRRSGLSPTPAALRDVC